MFVDAGHQLIKANARRHVFVLRASGMAVAAIASKTGISRKSVALWCGGSKSDAGVFEVPCPSLSESPADRIVEPDILHEPRNGELHAYILSRDPGECYVQEITNLDEALYASHVPSVAAKSGIFSVIVAWTEFGSEHFVRGQVKRRNGRWVERPDPIVLSDAELQAVTAARYKSPRSPLNGHKEAQPSACENSEQKRARLFFSLGPGSFGHPAKQKYVDGLLQLSFDDYLIAEYLAIGEMSVTGSENHPF